jgi:hypothetical protein
MAATTTCASCGEREAIESYTDAYGHTIDPSALGGEPLCRACVLSAAEYGRRHVREAWCPVAGCFGEVAEDGAPCALHAIAIADDCTLCGTRDCDAPGECDGRGMARHGR